MTGHYDEHPLPHLAHAGATVTCTAPAAGMKPIAARRPRRLRARRAPARPRRRPLRRALARRGRAARRPAVRGASCQLRGWPTTCTAWLERRLRRIDQRYTTGRRAIIDLLVSAGHPVSIGDIAEHLPGLPRSSAYRHLADLHSAGPRPACHRQRRVHPVRARRRPHRAPPPPAVRQLRQSHRRDPPGRLRTAGQPRPSASSPTPRASRPAATASTCSASAQPASNLLCAHAP